MAIRNNKKLASAARLLGSKGGRVTAERLSPEQRRQIAINAANSRWTRYREQLKVATS